MCHKVASLHCLHSGMTHHITLHTSYLYFLIPTLNLSNKFEMMRVDWESLKVSSCTLNTPHHNISQQWRSGQRNYTTTLFTLCRKIFASVLDKIFLHWIFYPVCHISHVLSNAHPCQAAGAGKASPSPGIRLSCLGCGKKDAKDPSAILWSSYCILGWKEKYKLFCCNRNRELV